MTTLLRLPASTLLLRCLAASLLATSLGIACRDGGNAGTRFEASAAAKRYPITGVVRAVKPGDRALTVAHEPIEGLMDGMTMDFVVADAWVLEAAGPGDRISALLVLDGARSWLEGVSITKGGGGGPAAGGQGVEVVEPGTPLPSVALVNQDGESVSTASYQGRPAVYTFIYTRCPMPDYCPLMMRRLDEIAARLREDGRRDDVWLLAVTLDPAFDRPPVLKAFGDRMIEAPTPDARYARTALLTGEPDAIAALASTFQLTYDADGDEIIHGLRTAVVDAEGRVVRTFSGSEWSADDVVRALPRT